MSVRVFARRDGHSEVIVLEGLGDDFNPNIDLPVYLAFSDGTIIKFRLDQETGVWRINVEVPGTSRWFIEYAEDRDGFSDAAENTEATITWCVAGDFLSSP